MSWWHSEQSQPAANISLCPCHPPRPPQWVPHAPSQHLQNAHRDPTSLPRSSAHLQSPLSPKGDVPSIWHPPAQEGALRAMHTR